ncbi:dihydrolipoamide dehydrogenase [Terribacillus aidingensis]|uniref:Dihydrolipoyl dehydrogenase n=1 Tax=Terribacillus aidingensis TaxID=586416 RepID=A0A285NMU0_9BACI|nr:dihydrolipoyl dehydrogenase [Terribacillus aidingensis]SNZ10548.1 dihydrolipoamide dehydrogenase [Terribacillus aidingensis]
MVREYDIVILGGGTGGYVAAIRASQLGLKTAIVEKAELGGTCLHRGCIPSKALLRSAEVYRQTKEAAAFGIHTTNVRLDFEGVQKRKTAIIDQLHRGVQHLMKKGKIDVFQGFGRILGPSIFSPTAGTISVEFADGSENEILLPKNVIVATGSTPRSLPGIEFDENRILSSEGALALTELPETMTIIGGGVIGIEWASMLHDLGTKVTVLEYRNRILPTEDEQISKEMEKQLKKRGITIHTNVKVESAAADDSQVTVTAQMDGDKQVFVSDKILLSVGRSANAADIGLKNTEIQLTEQGYIATNAYYQTNESHIYAIGDVIGGMQLAHVASREGIVAVEHIAGVETEALDYSTVPACVYSYPETASVGMTEAQAKAEGYTVKSGKMSFQAVGKALVYGETEGFVKIIADEKTNDLLGVHMIGPHVTDMISEAALAKLLDATPWEIGQSIHPHPTLSEIIGEAALAVDGKQIHG